MPNLRAGGRSQADICTRRFALDDQRRFAELTGDLNPIHLDALVARRTQAGALVVHGVHAVLWALDALIERQAIAERPGSLSVEFRRYIYVDTDVTLRVVRNDRASLRAVLIAGGVAATTLRIAYDRSDAPETSFAYGSTRFADTGVPLGQDFDDVVQRRGSFAGAAHCDAHRAFPAAATLLGTKTVGTIARLSTLVGMICPGLYSIFGGFTLRFRPELAGDDELRFAVTKADARIRMVEMSLSGPGIAGTISAFVRRPPVQQRLSSELETRIGADEFAATTALIVGGSRGIGAATARLIAAGGGRVAITYAVGEHDAHDIARDIGAATCRVLRFDALRDAAEQLEPLEWEITELYYFATPPIFRQRSAWYEPERHAQFSRIYVDGFAAVCTALRARGECFTAMYPSSAAIDERHKDLVEYSSAKAAGEVLCANMSQSLPGVSVLVKRLPRIDTDATATFVPTRAHDAAETMLPIVREMQRMSQSTRRALRTEVIPCRPRRG